LTEEQINNQLLTNTNNTNLSFEGIACDPANKKLYIATENDPKIIWSVDFTTGIYEVLIDVDSLPSWTIEDMNGITYDPLGESLYVLSSISKLIIQSSLNGTILGESLDISMFAKPGGLSFEPATGDLLVYGEFAEFARFSLIAEPSLAPVPTPSDETEIPVVVSPTASIVPVTVDAPVTSPPVTENPIALPMETIEPTEPPIEVETKLPKQMKSKDMKKGKMGKKDGGMEGKKAAGSMDAKKMKTKGMKGKKRVI
jgi:hypothetical protein